MDTFVPLFQTALWVGLILFAVLRFRRRIEDILDTVKTRIQTGSTFKAGPVELGEDFRILAKQETPTADLVLEQVKRALPAPEFEKEGGRIEESIRKAFVRVDSTPFLGAKGQVWDEPYDPAMPSWLFFNRLCAAMQPYNYRYLLQWVLRDKHSSKEVELVPRAMARLLLGDEDKPSLAEIGIVGGSELEIVPRRKRS